MNRDINAEKYSLLQLKAWCTAVGINASGAKASLAARLNELSAEARGLCPKVDKAGKQSCDNLDDQNKQGEDNGENNGEDNGDDNGEHNGDSNGEHNGDGNGEDNGRVLRSGNVQRCEINVLATNDDNDAIYIQRGVACVRSDTFGSRRTSYVVDNESSVSGTAENLATVHVHDDDEAAALKIQLLQKEIQLLTLQKATLQKDDTMASTSKRGDNIPFETLKDVIPTYDGGVGFST
ncbi:PREDICTED: merozoite surface antigen 2-like [Rhagoletis zephyria]|uniref:merozoite surface antigen 2-like n=1 Tax=Rhagoletis zephyria TaxID=28612 RepID=UPI00081155E7|nr:PREDICTED: merozoite surface antigen 2-like [Rhagoletis zephyria]